MAPHAREAPALTDPGREWPKGCAAPLPWETDGLPGGAAEQDGSQPHDDDIRNRNQTSINRAVIPAYGVHDYIVTNGH